MPAPRSTKDEVGTHNSASPKLLVSLKCLAKWTRSRKHKVALLFISAIGVVFSVGTLSYQGFCFRRLRFLSQQEYFDAAIKQVIESSSAQLVIKRGAMTEFISVKTRPYESVSQFYQMNPDCCRIVAHNTGDKGPYTTFTQRLFGYAAVVVSVSYVLNYVDQGGDFRSADNSMQAAVTNCGNVWNAQH